jgi:hypothetical protein
MALPVVVAGIVGAVSVGMGVGAGLLGLGAGLRERTFRCLAVPDPDDSRSRELRREVLLLAVLPPGCRGSGGAVIRILRCRPFDRIQVSRIENAPTCNGHSFLQDLGGMQLLFTLRPKLGSRERMIE